MTLLEGKIAVVLAGMALVFLSALMAGPRWALWLDKRKLDAALRGQRPDAAVADPAMPIPTNLEVTGLSVAKTHETNFPD